MELGCGVNECGEVLCRYCCESAEMLKRPPLDLWLFAIIVPVAVTLALMLCMAFDWL